VTSLAGVRSAIDARIRYMETTKAADKAAGRDPKFGFIIPRAQIEANIK